MISGKHQNIVRKKEFETRIVKGRKDNKPLELIIGVLPYTKFLAEKALSRVGTINHVFDLFDYIAFSCSPEVAQGFFNRFYSEGIASNSLKQLLRGVISADVASTFSIPPYKTKNEKDGIWNLERIGAYKARELAEGNVGVAIIDTGAEYSHEEIFGCFSDECLGYDFINNNKNPIDLNGHGTHVSGTVAGQNYGVSPGSRLYALRVLDENGSGSEVDLIRALEWCCKNEDVCVANMSLGGNTASKALEDACNYARGRNILLVAAAGNNSAPEPSYPAAFDSVIAVGATDRNDGHADFSNLKPDISAPGVDIVSSYINGGYASASGTSMACPHAAGTLALAYSLPREADLEGIMLETAENLYDYEKFGAGIVRADLLLEKINKRSLVEMVKQVIW